ncbi:MAG: sigma-54-dependent Fis family transcriptional regulator [candidate division NC10 bacterium]|nr:sigma-54-dependent Fis family transcriptional regulator [candidate division NC10 bacterium]
MGSAKVLVVDDDASARTLMERWLTAKGFDVLIAADGGQALETIRQEDPALVLLDLQMPRLSGLDVLRALREEDLDPTVIVVTAYGTLENAIEAMRAGAYDFITKPVDPKHLDVVVGKALERETLRARNRHLRRTLEAREVSFVAEGPAMRRVVTVARQVAQASSTVLLLGESGTGKEVLARAIVRWSPRQDKPLVVVNCAAMPEQLLESELFGHVKGAFTGAITPRKGLFEEAHGGTLFLDEIGDMPPITQAKLLRVVEDGEVRRLGSNRPTRVDARILAATNRDLEAELRAGRFRQDLYFRLNVVAIRLPPLRERPEDLPLLVEHLLDHHARETKKGRKQLTPDALACLRSYSWPGNVRELSNVLERAVLLTTGAEISSGDLALPMGGDGGATGDDDHPLRRASAQAEREAILQALQETGGNITRAAKRLGLSRYGLQLKMRRLGLQRPGPA